MEPEPALIDPQRFPDVRTSDFRAADGTPTYIVPAAKVVEILRYLRDVERFTMLEDVTAIDWYPKEPRFQVVYNLLSIERQKVIRIKVDLPAQNPTIATVTNLWPGANWYEREVFDLFGINFEGHPDLRRIELPEDWDGHPLRRDYPVTGPRRANLPANWIRVEGRSGSPQ
ncbi:MAG: NADH-quinone oxidoreductase subunit C [Chloroflexota bacterium]